MTDPRTNVYLSLYLVIFGFFIVLVNASEISKPKSSAAIASVKETLFQNKSVGTEAASSQEVDLTPAQKSIADAKSELSASFAKAQFQLGNDGKDLRIDLEADLLFYRNTAAIKADARGALARLGDILSGHTVRNSVLISVPRSGTMQDNESWVSDFDLRRAQTINGLIAGSGTGPAAVFIGYSRQDAQTIALVIRAQDINSREVGPEGAR